MSTIDPGITFLCFLPIADGEGFGAGARLGAGERLGIGLGRGSPHVGLQFSFFLLRSKFSLRSVNIY